MKRLFAVVALMALAACDRSEAHKLERAQEAAAKSAVQPQSDRVVVQRIDTVQDGLAYGGYRGIYVIKDKVTGKEFIGVSGVGIAETGSHREGKVSHQDER